jgi:hypothetical protein
MGAGDRGDGVSLAVDSQAHVGQKGCHVKIGGDGATAPMASHWVTPPRHFKEAKPASHLPFCDFCARAAVFF